jgi:hypothetical protein
MAREITFRTARWFCLGLAVILFAGLIACHRGRDIRDIEVTAKTTISGSVNGSPIAVDVVATFNTGRGGSSTCKFTQLPTGFTPASLGTHM